jgi:Cu(I)/Ag(I) efflux system membrane fusion protein
MHPEVVKDGPGTCDVCGMPLVRAESLGYAGPAEEAEPPLVIPVSAPLLTGTRAVVYVQTSEDPPTFQGREVVLGPRAGQYYIVREGLAEGDRVVTNGSFKIDSELEIQAKKSMMSLPGGPVARPPEREPEPLEVPDAFRKQLSAALAAYLDAWRALAADDPKQAQAAGKALLAAVSGIDAKALEGRAQSEWLKERTVLRGAAESLAGAEELPAQREAFDRLSESFPILVRTFGHTLGGDIIQFQCPMAFNNRGATWLQDSEGLLNPYFGASMLKCGTKLRTIETSEAP